MPTEEETAEQVLDLLVLGLAWVQEQALTRSSRGLLGWLGVGVLRTMGELDVLDTQTCRQVTNDPPRYVRDYAYSRIHLEQLSGRRNAHGRVTLPGRPALRVLMRESDRLVLVMVHSSAYFGDMIFKPKGYKLIVSDRGQEHARGVAERYSSLDRQAFLDGWGDQVRIMRNAYSTFVPSRRRR